MNGQEWMGLFSTLGMVLGFVLQKVPNSKINTKLIPAIITGMMLLKNMLIGAGKLPADAVMFDVTWLTDLFATPGGLTLAFFGGWFGTVLQIVVQSVLDAALPVGLHSGIKNSMQMRARKAR